MVSIIEPDRTDSTNILSSNATQSKQSFELHIPVLHEFVVNSDKKLVSFWTSKS